MKTKYLKYELILYVLSLQKSYIAVDILFHYLMCMYICIPVCVCGFVYVYKCVQACVR